MRAILAALALLAAAAQVPAVAQAPNYLQRPSTVSVQYTLRLPQKSDDVDEQQRVTENGRKQLYEIAAKECAAILSTLASSCKLFSLNVQSNNFRQRNEDNFVTMTASAQYQIELKTNDAAAKEQSNGR